MFIKAYGEFWSRDCIVTSGKRIEGRRKHQAVNCNVWEQRGVYALYENFKIVYVGLADKRGMGTRLSAHFTDRLRKRWDSFSWFGVCDFDDKGEAKPYLARPSTQTQTIRSLELLAIVMSDAPLNRQQGKFPGAERVWQVDVENPTKKESELTRQLNQILEEVRSLKRLTNR